MQLGMHNMRKICLYNTEFQFILINIDLLD